MIEKIQIIRLRIIVKVELLTIVRVAALTSHFLSLYFQTRNHHRSLETSSDACLLPTKLNVVNYGNQTLHYKTQNINIKTQQCTKKTNPLGCKTKHWCTSRIETLRNNLSRKTYLKYNEYNVTS